MVEKTLKWYGTTNDLRSVSLRYFNAAGASFDGRIGEDWSYSTNLIPLVMKSIMLGNIELKVFGNDYPTPDGTCIRDYIHIEDLAKAHVSALTYLSNGGDTVAVNVGTGTGSSVYDVINATEAVAGLRVPYEVVDRRSGDPVSTVRPARVRSTDPGLEGPNTDWKQS